MTLLIALAVWLVLALLLGVAWAQCRHPYGRPHN